MKQIAKKLSVLLVGFTVMVAIFAAIPTRVQAAEHAPEEDLQGDYVMFKLSHFQDMYHAYLTTPGVTKTVGQITTVQSIKENGVTLSSEVVYSGQRQEGGDSCFAYIGNGGKIIIESDSKNIKWVRLVDPNNATKNYLSCDNASSKEIKDGMKIWFYINPNQKSVTITSTGATNFVNIVVGLETGASSGAHTHNYVYTTICSPSEDHDGEYAYVCSCGDTKDRQIIPAMDTIWMNRAAQVDASKSGQTITLDMGTLNSLPNWFMKKIADKNSTNFKIKFTFDHKNYEMNIPAGTTIDLNEAWYGPLKLMSLYETVQKN